MKALKYMMPTIYSKISHWRMFLVIGKKKKKKEVPKNAAIMATT